MALSPPPIKLLMVDVDGVLLRRPADGHWTDRIERDLGISPEDLFLRYFAEREREVLLGQADLHERMTETLAAMGSSRAADEVIAYLLRSGGELDQRLWADLAELKADGVALHLATNQVHLRADHLWTRLDLRRSFDAMHYSAELGVMKPDPRFYSLATQRAALPAAAIGFIDDREENVLAARKAGWCAHHWQGDSCLGDALAAFAQA